MKKIELGSNIFASVIEVIHFRLNPASKEPNKWASECPICKEGELGVRRDPKTYLLQEYDNCLLCGQPVKYLDIEEMRENDWAGKVGR